MPRAVSPWTWRRMLRDHFDGSQTELLTMFVIGTYMDNEGFAFPSQELIAKGSRSSVRTVRRHVEVARDRGWIGVSLSGRPGKGWRHQCYQACVPGYLTLPEKDEAIADAVAAVAGNPEGPDTAMSPPSPHGPDKAMSARTGTGQAPDGAQPWLDRTPAAQGPDKSSEGPDTAMTARTGHSYGRLTPALTPASITHALEARLAPSERDRDRDQEQDREQKTEPVAGPARFARLGGGSRGLPGKVDDDRPRRIRAYAANLPDQSVGQIAHVFACGIEEVRKALAEASA